MPGFELTVQRFLDELFELHPDLATRIGDHRFDDRWPDLTERGREARLAFVDRWDGELRAIDDASLDDGERIDRDLILGELAHARFDDEVLREDAWNPLWWVYRLGAGIHPLLAREFAPLDERLASVAARLEAVPDVLAAARTVLGSHPERPVAEFMTEHAGKRIGGIAALATEAVEAAEAAARTGDEAVAAILPRLRAAAESATAGLEEMRRWLAEELAPRATGSTILGSELFEAKLRHTLRDPNATTAAILARAERDFAVVRSEMVAIARRIWSDWLPGEPAPDDEAQLVRRVLDRTSDQHPAADELVSWSREELERVEAFCRDHDVIGLVDEPLVIDWTPEFMRSFGGAMLDAPGPLDHGQKSFFSITPVPDDWPADQRESYLREMNTRQMQLLVIHEAVPGHYLQGAYANHGSSLARRVFTSGVFAEGWAVYVTQVMLDRGYCADDDALWLNHWKFYLRSIANTIIDVKVHTQGMTSDELVSFLVDSAFQERGEAVSKDERARLSSTQLSTYFAGSLGMWDLEHELRRRAAVAAGGSADDVPAPRVVGGYPATPGFDERAHLESVISHGAPPFPILRRILLGEV
ncbi:MAG TPA: DUF885 domain-containing protein [Candidatus Limnocylindrales bacterium]|nr:DUF885 domain-containing protein [Candidatus Limnocylindrales bacterium]